jgi:gluconate 2-dehydrogenase gamma chain
VSAKEHDHPVTKTTRPVTSITRRELITGTTLTLAADGLAQGGIIQGELPWQPGLESTPQAAHPGPWRFFTSAEGTAMEALADRIIPADPQTPGGQQAGCAVFIDRQLAGPYGHREGEYLRGPFVTGSKQQGPQSSQGPEALYQNGLAALDRHCRMSAGGRSFAELSGEQQDGLLSALEAGTLSLEGVDGRGFFQQVIKDVQQGFFADPIYGGNRDMCAWKMIGFPGARYDYRDWVGRHNERYPLPPVSIAGRPGWSVKKD